MNSITKIIGSIEEQKSDLSGRIKIHRFKLNDNYITDHDEIKNQFPPEGFVFAPKFFEKYDIELNTLIEFSINPFPSIPKMGQKLDTTLMDVSKECRNVGHKIYSVKANILLNSNSIDQKFLKNYISNEKNHFYIHSKGYLYGPFKYSNNEIIPKIGKEVFKYESDNLQLFETGENIFILNEPTNPICKIDCMTIPQLTDWFKQQIKNININIDYSLLKRSFESQELNELDEARIKRAFTQIDQLQLSQENLNLLINSSEILKIELDKIITKYNLEIKEEILLKVNNEKQEILKEITINKNILNSIKEQVEKSKDENLNLIKEQEYINQNKERFYNDLKILSPVFENFNTNNNLAFSSFEIQEYINECKNYDDLNHYLHYLVQNINNTDENTNYEKYIKAVVYQLKYHKAFISNNISLIKQIAKATNNSRILIQQVEPDWIKFENFFHNGLNQICKYSIENPEVIHFLILEDINMSSIECYGKPILDIINGVRNKLPNNNINWPNNLWLFGIPIERTEKSDFGLPLLESTYKNWGAFPEELENISIEIDNTSLLLNISEINNHSTFTSNYISHYFEI
ncbi:MAG: hypothetical protein CFE25_06755 [Chitinophagaceae bacterium BSSC1]|nr:MAG: hypothetical protein CFE25_06755 [Chitinophagaceae bacterium BSSC1]